MKNFYEIITTNKIIIVSCANISQVKDKTCLINESIKDIRKISKANVLDMLTTKGVILCK